jgi:hypothetical protein
MRAWLVIAASVFAVVGFAGGAAAQRDATPAYYLVRPDLRLCPSPICGGAWVRRVNHATTRCVDGSEARECYVASTAGVPEKLWSARAGSVLVRGRIVPAGIEGFPDLGKLAAVAAWRPAGQQEPRGTIFRVVDNGVRCVTSPCFSLTAFVLETERRRTLSEIGLAGVGASAADLRRAQRGLAVGGVLVTGAVRTVPDAGPAGAGRTLRATQIWLRP